ncbi:Hypothetical predicted protein [Lecanosticta acicola]|uniref:Uncharacterized protein n=1 Tax=Lecanosticta acicola TaxID=111012 RepID=A0AAI8W0T9_9PEZI|nr:Hypothetical predicted protein [Lecanosticta acicola]
MIAEGSASNASIALYTLLPAVVQKRIPRFRTLKRALSQYESYHKRISSYSSDRSFTPPPSYRSSPEDAETTDEDSAPYRSHGDSAAPSRPSSSGSLTPIVVPQESRSGIQWKYADAGFALLSLASQEASGDNIALSSNLVRRQYIDGVACMVRGLPAELSEEEELSLREALPASIRAGRHGDVTALTRGERRPGQAVPLSPQSSLHRSVATVTLYLFLAVAFVLPYLQLFLRLAYQWDRKHKVSDRVLARSVAAADAVGKRTMMLATSICAMNEGKVGDTMRQAGIYLMQGVSGGVYDGVGEALRIRADETPHDKSRC